VNHIQRKQYRRVLVLPQVRIFTILVTMISYFRNPISLNSTAIGRRMSPGESTAFASNYFFRFVSRDSEL
jgi:hypothetical protein